MEEIKNILYEEKGNTALVTINRPDKMNALNEDTLLELMHTLTDIMQNDDIYSVIITGAGEKAFIAGADINELNSQDLLTGIDFARFGQEVFNIIENLGKPVIAAVNGYALGGGCELSLACHIRLASNKAKFGQPEVNLGIIPGYGGTQRLPRIIGHGRAMEYILTGDMIDAEEALRIGLANKVYPADELMGKAFEMAEKINSKGQIAVRNSVEAVNKTKEMTQKDGLAYEASLFSICCGTADFEEGTRAFLEKRKPEFINK